MSSKTASLIFNGLSEQLGWKWWYKKEWLIYGANNITCPDCEAMPGVACRHLTDIRTKGFDEARIIANPHPPRINWDRIFDGMLLRGWINHARRQEIRNAL